MVVVWLGYLLVAYMEVSEMVTWKGVREVGLGGLLRWLAEQCFRGSRQAHGMQTGGS